MPNIIQYDSNFLVTDSTLKNVVWVTYGTTTYAQVLAYINVGQVPCVERNGRKYILSSTDTNYEVLVFSAEGYTIELWNSKSGQSNVWVDASQQLVKCTDPFVDTLNFEDYFDYITSSEYVVFAVPPLVDLILNKHDTVRFYRSKHYYYLSTYTCLNNTYIFTFTYAEANVYNNNSVLYSITIGIPVSNPSTDNVELYVDGLGLSNINHIHGDIDSNGKSCSFPTDVRRFLCADGNFINPDFSRCKPVMGFQWNSYADDGGTSGASPYIYKIFSFSGNNQWTSVYIRATWLQGFGAYLNEPPLDCTFWLKRGGGSSYPTGTVVLANINRVFSVSTPHPAVATTRCPFSNLYVRINGTTIEVYLRMWANGNYQQSFVVHEYSGNTDITFYNYSSSNRTSYRLNYSDVSSTLGSFTYYGAAASSSS